MSGAEPTSRHALVFGASGLVGKHLVLQLLRAGVSVVAAARTAESGSTLERWVREREARGELRTALVDFAAPEMFAGGLSQFGSITEIHNCAGLYRFGMSTDEAREANVGIVERILECAAKLPRLQRVLHVSGYRVGGQDPASVPWSDRQRSKVYAEAGAYEGSKMESDAVFQALATERGIPWTVLNPSSVIGHSVSGESDQLIGLASTIGQLYRGEIAALPGGRDVFLPVVTVDYLAAFMERAAGDPAAAGQAYWVLDEETPPLGDLLTHVGQHLEVAVPRLRLPVSAIRRLPRWLTKADPETLSFMSTDRYPTGSARTLAARHGLVHPNVLASLERWVDYLAAHRFGEAAGTGRRVASAAGVRTFALGAEEPRLLVFPGLPINADTWAGVADRLSGTVVDLPGLGLSGGRGTVDWDTWLPAVMPSAGVHLVGHSIGAAAALRAAQLNPAAVSSLTLVSPFFLQPRPARRAAPRWMVAGYLRTVSAARLSTRLTGATGAEVSQASTVRDLRGGGAKRVAAQLDQAASSRWRADLQDALLHYDGPLRVVVGAHDPLDTDVAGILAQRPATELVTIPDAGHHPHLTHPAQLAEVISRDAPQPPRR